MARRDYLQIGFIMAILDAQKSAGENAGEALVKVTWIDWLARFGYFVRGALYMLVGLLAVQVALGVRGSTENQTGALSVISAQPLGHLLLIGVAVGLAGYSLWGLIRAVLDPLKKGTSLKGLAERGGYIVSAVSYGALLVPTIRLLSGAGAEEGEAAKESTAFLYTQPFGEWVVALAGVVAIIGAVGQAYTGITARFKKDFKEETTEGELKLAIAAGRIGHLARAVVFALGGLFLIQSALRQNPEDVEGLDGALAAIAGGDKGLVALGLVALGLMAFGIYSIMCTRWIKLTKHEAD